MRPVQALVAAALVSLAATPTMATTPVLVGATQGEPGSWETQGGFPPSGPVRALAAQFSLSSDEFVSRIQLPVFGVEASPSFYRVSLVDSLISTTPLYSLVANSPATTDMATLGINQTLAAGTYFLRLQSTGFIGWAASNGSFVTTNGTVTDGEWQTDVAGDWYFEGPSAFPLNHPGQFAVFGADVITGSPTPEPAGWALLVGGFGVLGVMLRRSQTRRASAHA